MRLIFFAPFFSACALLYLVPAFTPVQLDFPYLFAIFLLLSVFVLSMHWKTIDTGRTDRKLLIFCFPVLIFLFYVPFPFNLSAVLILLGLFFWVLIPTRLTFQNIALGAMVSGLIFLFQTAMIPLLYLLMSRVHEVTLLNKIAYPILRLLGLQAGMSEDIIYVPFYQGLSAFPGTLEKTGFYFFALFMAGSTALLFYTRTGLRNWVAFFVSCIFYACLRYILMIVVFAQVNRADIFWHPAAVILSFLPLGFMGLFYGKLNRSFDNDLNRIADMPVSIRNIMSYLLFTFSVVCMVGVWGFYDPGTRKDGRILIDEKHSDWEWSHQKFDTTWYGSQSTYNYYCMSDYLNYFYHVEYNTERELTEELLGNYDVLIIKTPTQPFNDGEIDAMETFVENGGGLFLIGDHTNVFGMDYYLNFIAKRFGLFFHYDSTYDLDSGKLTFYEKPRIFPHPGVMHVPYFLFATSCTIGAPFNSGNVMIGYGLRSRLLSYSGRAFFEDDPLQNYEFGLFLQAVSVKKGRGRVIAFSDSTCFSNFYMFIPGKPELALGIVEWLNRKNRFGYVVYLLGGIGIIFMVVGFRISGSNKKYTGWTIGVTALFPGIIIGIAIFSQLTKAAYQTPLPHTPYQKIIFEKDHSDYQLPLKELVDTAKDNYHTFFVWTQRVGFVPQVTETLDACLQEKKLVVMITPKKPFTRNDIEKLVAFIEDGGKLLLLDGPENSQSVSNDILKHFDIEINYQALPNGDLYDLNNRRVTSVIKSGSVTGGDVLLQTKEGRPVFTVKKWGKGKVGVMANAYIFANPIMGGTQIKPSEFQQEIYKLEYYVLDIMK